MSLTFLVPLFLLGLAGIAIPVVLHLSRRQRRQVVRFPSLMFLQRIPYQEQQRRRIQHWFLLLMRALALALLALAFARPFFDRTEEGGGAGAGPREIVLLIDRSYSMATGDRMDRAREAARAALGSLGPLDRASVVTFDHGAHVLARSLSDPARLRAAVDTVQPGSGTTRYGPALKVAQTILEESLLSGGEVVLISDFRRNGWVGDEGIILPARSILTPVPVGSDEGENLQVAGVTLPRSALGGRERITPAARIVRRGGVGPREVLVSLALDGQEIQRASLTLEPDEAATLGFQPFTLSLPHTTGVVRIVNDEGDGTDAIGADDVRFFALSPGSPLSVLIVDGPRPEDPTPFLARALEITEDGRFRVTRRSSPSLSPGDLEGVDVLVLHDVGLDAPSAEATAGFAEGGGAVLLALGGRSTWPSAVAGFLPGTLGTTVDRVERGGRLGYLDYGHPVFEIFAGPRGGDFTNARFHRTRRFTPADSARILARFDDGSAALVEGASGAGRVAVWSTTLDSFWNDLALQPVYLPFVHRIIEHLGGRTEAVPSFTAGQVLDLASPEALRRAGLAGATPGPLVEGQELVALTPSGGAIPLPTGTGPRYLPLDEQGHYTLRAPGSQEDRPFVLAVNVDLTESDPTPIDPDEMVSQVAISSTEGPRPARGTGAEALERTAQERRQSLWRWLLVGALALLAAETVVSNVLLRRGAGQAIGS